MFRRATCGPLALVAAVLLATTATAHRIETETGADGIVTVVVTDTEGRPIGGARVSVEVPTLTDVRYTDPQGQAMFDPLPAATYRLTTSQDGYSSVEYPTVIVSAGRTTPVVVELALLPPADPLGYCRYGARGSAYTEAECVGGEFDVFREFGDLLPRAGEGRFDELAGDPTFEGYRFVWNTPVKSPVVVVVSQVSGASPTISTKLVGRGPRYVLQLSRARLLGLADFQQLLALLAELEFWELPPRVWRKPADGSIEVCCSGHEWTLEGVKNGRYHYIYRFCPPEDWPIRSLGTLFMSLSDLNAVRIN